MSLIQKGGRRFCEVLLTFAVVVGAMLMLASCSVLDSGGSHVEGPPRDTTPVVLEITQPGTLVVTDENNRAVIAFRRRI